MNKQHLDQEWVELMKQAKELGLTKNEVRLFLRENSKRDDLQTSVVEKVN